MHCDFALPAAAQLCTVRTAEGREPTLVERRTSWLGWRQLSVVSHLLSSARHNDSNHCSTVSYRPNWWCTVAVTAAHGRRTAVDIQQSDQRQRHLAVCQLLLARVA